MTQDILCNSVSGPVTIAEKGVQVALEGGDLVYKKILVPIDFSEHSKKTVHTQPRLPLGTTLLCSFCMCLRCLTFLK
jgi:hypothetical protein